MSTLYKLTNSIQASEQVELKTTPETLNNEIGLNLLIGSTMLTSSANPYSVINLCGHIIGLKLDTKQNFYLSIPDILDSFQISETTFKSWKSKNAMCLKSLVPTSVIHPINGDWMYCELIIKLLIDTGSKMLSQLLFKIMLSSDSLSTTVNNIRVSIPTKFAVKCSEISKPTVETKQIKYFVYLIPTNDYIEWAQKNSSPAKPISTPKYFDLWPNLKIMEKIVDKKTGAKIVTHEIIKLEVNKKATKGIIIDYLKSICNIELQSDSKLITSTKDLTKEDLTKIFKSDVIEPFIESENTKRLNERKTKARNSNKKSKKVDEIPDLSTNVTDTKVTDTKVEPKVTEPKVEPKVVNALTLDDSDSDDEFSKLILKSD